MKRKNVVSLLLKGVFACTLLAGTYSCAEDPDEPEKRDLFIGTYKGKVTYINPSEDKKIIKSNGSVTIVKVSTKYDFLFSDGIPPIKGVKMEGDKGDFHGSISTEGASFISIKNGHLKLDYVKGTLDEVWTADCKKS